jgi:hypothetical protein
MPTPAQPAMTAAVSLANPARSGHEPIDSLCEHDPNAGIQLCQEFAPSDPSGCADDCLHAYAQVHPPAVRIASARNAGLPPTEPAAPSTPPDPYVLALGECVRRVRDGDPDPVCRFFHPLDEMDFGQKHCDAKCGALTEGFRASHSVAN